MRHIISILLQNEAGALARVANLFSSRGYNIESLNVAPTHDETVSRLTLVTRGSDEVIDQISKQLGKLVDVVNIIDMTDGDHIERELALFKLQLPAEDRKALTELVGEFGARILDDHEGHFTVELIGGSGEIDRFMTRCIERDIELIVTTEKDAVRFPHPRELDVDICFLRIEVEIIEGEGAWDRFIEHIVEPRERKASDWAEDRLIMNPIGS